MDSENKQKTLNINYTHNTQLYINYIKHSSHLSVMSSSLRDKANDNQHTQADISLKKTFINVGLPYPISSPFDWDIENDPCLNLVQEKDQYKKKLNAYRYLYKKDRRKMTKTNINRNAKKGYINLPSYLVDLTLNEDKNPYFDGTYDWFYTGGNLDVIEVGNTSFLFNAHGNIVESLNLENHTSRDMEIKFVGPIYSIKGHNIDNASYMTVRTKQVIKLITLKLDPLDLSFSSKVLCKCKAKEGIPYIDSIVLDKGQLVTANVAYTLNVHDVEANAVKYERKFDLETDHKGDLCQLGRVDNSLMFMSTRSFKLIDFRASPEENEKKKDFKEGFFTCNCLCTFSVSSINENIVYVASKHNVYKLDTREMAVVKKWAHLLDNSPIIIKPMLGKNNGEEYVFVASFCEIVCIHVSSFNHLPFRISNIYDTFNKLKIERDFLMREDLEQRFKLLTAGLAVDKSIIYTANGIGDVYRHNVNEDESKINSVSVLQSYVGQIQHKPRKLQVTHFKDHSAMTNILFNATRHNDNLEIYEAPKPCLEKYLNPSKEFRQHDMALIWESAAPTPLEDDKVEDRIGTWLAQSAVEEFDPNENEMNEFNYNI